MIIFIFLQDIKLSGLVIFFLGGALLLILTTVGVVMIHRNNSTKIPITNVTPVTTTKRDSYGSQDEKGHTNPVVSPFHPDD